MTELLSPFVKNGVTTAIDVTQEANWAAPIFVYQSRRTEYSGETRLQECFYPAAYKL